MEKAIKKYWPLFLLPTLAAFVIGFIIPFVQGVYLSFCKFQTVNKATFVGVSNYVKAVADPAILAVILADGALHCGVNARDKSVRALTVALLLTRNIKGTNLFQNSILHAKSYRRHRPRLHMADTA